MGGAGTPKINPTPYLILGINVSKNQKNLFTPSKDKLQKPLCPQTEYANADNDDDNAITKYDRKFFAVV